MGQIIFNFRHWLGYQARILGLLFLWYRYAKDTAKSLKNGLGIRIIKLRQQCRMSKKLLSFHIHVCRIATVYRILLYRSNIKCSVI